MGRSASAKSDFSRWWGNLDTFYATVRKILHKTNSYHIFGMEPEKSWFGRSTTVTGHIFGILQLVEGMALQVFGEWVTHPKFGRQFQLTGWKPWAKDPYAVGTFLRSGLGMYNEEAIQRIVSEFGTKTFEVLSEEPKRLSDLLESMNLPGIYDTVMASWQLAHTSAELSEFFSDKDVTSVHIQAVFETFGVSAREVIQANPYELVRVDAFSFAKVDEVADRMGVDRSDPRRYEGAVFWVLREAAKSGHLCVRRGDFASQLIDLTQQTELSGFGSNLSVELIAAVGRLADRKAVVVDPNVGVYLPVHYRFERTAAKLLSDFITPLKLDVPLADFIDTYETMNSISLSQEQRDAVEKLVNNKVLVLTGLPGTGKTTVIKTFVALFQRAGLTFSLMAPTGIAAKRLASVAGSDAATIHRSFRFNGMQWSYNEGNKYPVQAVIVDEVSMVDMELFFRIVSALNEDTILVFVGDDAQLSSVGPGNVLRELIQCEGVPTVRLTQIFRQKETSDIILNSHRVNRGEGIQTNGPKSDFQFVQIGEEEKILDLIVKMAVKLKEKDANFQILAPKYDGTVGVTSLNEHLREALNPPSDGKSEFSSGTFRVRLGDRVMVIKNDYDLNIYNGDMGKVVAINAEALVIRVHGAGEGGLDMNVSIPRKDAMLKLRLAYAITVHKSQGSEFDTVIIPVVKSQGRMLQRNLFYTAITRAKKKVWLLGEASAVSKAIANDKVVLRNTGFERAITEAMKVRAAGVVGIDERDPATEGQPLREADS